LRSATAAAVTGLLLLAVTGCGGDDPPEAAPAETETETEPEASEPEPEPEPEATPELGVDVVEFVVPYEPGGGYDQYVRLMAPFLGECTGAQVVPINEPGAGSLLATNQTAIAPADGSRIQIFNTIGVISAQLAEADGVNFDLAEFTWLARIANEPSAISVGADSEFDDLQDLIDADRPIRFVATGPGSNEYIFAVVLGEVFGFEVEMITGFAGSGEAQASVIQGHADAHVLSLGSSLGPIEAGDLRPLGLIGSEPAEALPDTPTVYDYDPVEGQEEVLDGLVGLVETARAVAGPPGMDEATTTALRDGLECVLTDDAFVEQAVAQGRDVAFLPGDEMQQTLVDVLEGPEALRTLILESY
jgi:tripartite-type tricarboxylate transporter receptor subunit TctC